ncbi:thioesterase domain-containing protein [Nocardia vinacea]|uniref:thioesterase domain-containing protein n=1 Tax=Nocardia vinacea TaxID=96468 RepID=UPI0033D5BBAA
MSQRPRDATEIELCCIWQTVLREYVSDIDLNFFVDLGGTSGAAVRVIIEIQRVFGVHLKISELVSVPTIRMLANRLAGNGLQGRSSPIVSIQKGADETPLYLFHPLPGTLVKYCDLIRSIGSAHTIWGLQSFGIEQGTVPLDTIEEMADSYASHMLKEHPGGPWRLAGYSMGGNLAVEVARRLDQKGEDIDLVCVLDSGLSAIDTDIEPVDVDLVRTWSIYRLAHTMLDLDFATEVLDGMPYPRQIEEVVKRGRNSGALANDFHIEQFLRFVDVRVRNYLAIVRYQPEGFYRGSMVLIRSSGAGSQDQFNGWAGSVGSIELHEIPGDHFSMMYPPGVQRVAAIIRSKLLREGLSDV